MTDSSRKTACTVAIIGSGPAGVGAALALHKAGIDDVVILERDQEAGGVPRHCGHPPFGLREYHRILAGPSYAARNIQAITEAGTRLLTGHTVTRLGKGGSLDLVTSQGARTIAAQRVLLATGTRETPRAARFVSGGRPLGILNTGALQAMIYLKGMIPFRSPLVVGTELVSFSALWTCKKAGIRPVVMIDEEKKAGVSRLVAMSHRYMGVPMLLGVEIINIQGKDRVESVTIRDGNGAIREFACDGVLFTGRFVPEASLARLGDLCLDPATGCPVVDSEGRCSDPAYFAAGNLVHAPVRVAGQCYRSGVQAGLAIARDLGGRVHEKDCPIPPDRRKRT